MVDAIGLDDSFWHSAFCVHGPAVLAFLRRRTGREEAEDILQETFVRAIRAGTYRGDHPNARAYLMSTARHVLINRLRRPRLVVAAEELGARAGVPAEGDALAAVASADASPEENAAWRAFRERLDRVLDGLKESYRQAFELAVVQQRSYAEVARLTGWSLPRVKINVYRARKRVIAGLADYLPDRGATS